MAKNGPVFSLSACLVVFYGLGACGTQSKLNTEKMIPKSDSIRTEAFETFVKMARLSCTYKLTEAISSADIAERECESAVVKKKSSGKWMEEWKKTLGNGLTPLQFDSLCLNFTRVTTGEMPLPVSGKILKNGKKLAGMNEEAVTALLKLTD